MESDTTVGVLILFGVRSGKKESIFLRDVGLMASVTKSYDRNQYVASVCSLTPSAFREF
jgi:hypothetical protein